MQNMNEEIFDDIFSTANNQSAMPSANELGQSPLFDEIFDNSSTCEMRSLDKSVTSSPEEAMMYVKRPVIYKKA